MLLKSIKLNNIRSYVDEEIKFPEGSVLLSGDIGAGKSTILQAIEFAFFGILKGELSGTSLLRRGKNSGYAEAAFDLDGREIIVRRTLKRTSKATDTVAQDSGHIIIGGKKYELTPQELKSKILEMIGYPDELTTKSKSLIYRYTVYTPQEAMKEILFERKEERLNTLRIVFGVEKYKRIVENAEIILKKLREKRKEMAGRIFDLPEKAKQLQLSETELAGIRQKIESILPEHKKYLELLKLKKEEIKISEEKISLLNNLKRERDVNDVKLQEIVRQHSLNSEELLDADSKIKSLTAKLGELKPTKTTDRHKIESEIELLELEVEKTSTQIGTFEAAMERSEEVKKSISKLDRCPTCLQPVSPDHKHKIETEESRRTEASRSQLELLKKKKKELADKIVGLKKSLKSVEESERVSLQQKALKDHLDELSRRKELVLKSQNELKSSIGELNSRKLDIADKLKAVEGVEKNYLLLKLELDEVQEAARKVELQKVGSEKEAEGMEKAIVNLKSEVAKKTRVKEGLEALSKKQNWLEEFFINVVKEMEKHVMVRAYAEFNELFQKWADTLIEDEAISIKLDEEFTPMVEQNGYQAEISDLSGGEKTSCALAYRLALNKVINDLMSTIKTNDIIILDEPTDGFSSEQLDKVRDVLEQLNVKQAIIVSHEAKLESFVSSIIRIAKSGHVSRVIGT